MERAHTPEPAPDRPETDRPAGAGLASGLLAAVAALALFALLGDEVRGGGTMAVDLRLRSALHGLATPALTRVMWGASLYGAPRSLAVLGLVTAFVCFWRGWARVALLILVTLAGAGLIGPLLKLLFARTRPAPFFQGYHSPASFSFPSGHALFATCFFGGVALLASARLGSRRLRAAVWLAALVAIALVGISRVYLGVHYPSDVLGGYAVGIFWLATVALGDRLATRRRWWAATSPSPRGR